MTVSVVESEGTTEFSPKFLAAKDISNAAPARGMCGKNCVIGTALSAAMSMDPV